MATTLYTMIGVSRQHHARPHHTEDFQPTTINSPHSNNAEPSQWGTKGGDAGGINVIKKHDNMFCVIRRKGAYDTNPILAQK